MVASLDIIAANVALSPDITDDSRRAARLFIVDTIDEQPAEITETQHVAHIALREACLLEKPTLTDSYKLGLTVVKAFGQPPETDNPQKRYSFTATLVTPPTSWHRYIESSDSSSFFAVGPDPLVDAECLLFCLYYPGEFIGYDRQLPAHYNEINTMRPAAKGEVEGEIEPTLFIKDGKILPVKDEKPLEPGAVSSNKKRDKLYDDAPAVLMAQMLHSYFELRGVGSAAWADRTPRKLVVADRTL